MKKPSFVHAIALLATFPVCAPAADPYLGAGTVIQQVKAAAQSEKKSSLAPLLALLAALPFCAPAADLYTGAGAVIQQVQAAAQSGTTSNASNGADSAKKLLHDLKDYRETVSTLTPEEAASRWLAFADRLAKLPINEFNDPGLREDGNYNMGLGSLFESLPPPADWNALVKAADARQEGKGADAIRTRILRLSLHWLTGDQAGQKKDMAALSQITESLKAEVRPYAMQALTELQVALLKNSDDGEAVLDSLTKQLSQSENIGNMGSIYLSVPDLVSLVGEKKTAEFLKKAFKSEHVRLNMEEGLETRKLARKLALQMVDQLKSPQWNLAHSLDSTALFEAMSKRFPKPDTNNGDRLTAQAYYMLGLIASQRTKDAVAMAKQLGDRSNFSLPEEGLLALEQAGYKKAVADFLHDLLEQNPGLPFWNSYVDIAPGAGQTDKMVALAEAVSQREGMTPRQKREVLGVLSRAYLAADDLDKGVAMLRKQIAATAEMPAEQNQNDEDGPAMKLIKLGAVLDRKDLQDEGVNTMREALKKATPGQAQNHLYTLQEEGRLLMKCKRGPEAEAIFADALAKAQQPRPGGYRDDSGSRRILISLLALYHEANRPDDVLALLDRAPFWGVKDLRNFYSESVTINNNEEYAGYFAASALGSSGRTAEALTIMETLLEKEGGYDPAYELLLRLAPQTAPAKLDALIARDPFEVRPLIWKAKLLLKSGKLEEAEKCARQAISIDPTDGEHGPGRRLLAYATLGEIRAARGDAKEAAFLKEVLVSVEHSQHADDLASAGLVTRSLKLYEEALTHFADAYCIQARIAFRMSELGDLAGAEEHYRRAYELMPESFGRMESFCFGCEGAFRGAQAQGIAERVFTKLAAKNPEKPQIHYLLGYLRSEQNRYEEALPEFSKAVKIDPDYLNAWKKIADLNGKIRLPSAERDAIQFNLLRLDPRGRHSSFEFSRITNLREAWTAMEAAAKTRKPVPQSLYPLAASTEEIARLKKESARHPEMMVRDYFPGDFREDITPGKQIAAEGIVGQFNQWFLMAASQLYLSE